MYISVFLYVFLFFKLSLLPKIRTLNQTDLQETVRNYLIASLAFSMNGATAVCLVCLLR